MTVSQKYYKIFKIGRLVLFLILLFLSLNHYFEISKNLLDPESSKIINYKNYFVVFKNLDIFSIILLGIIFVILFGIILLVQKRDKGFLPRIGIVIAGYCFGSLSVLFVVIDKIFGHSIYNFLVTAKIWIFYEKFLYLGITSLIFLNAFFVGFYLLNKIFKTKDKLTTGLNISETVFLSTTIGIGIVGFGTLIIGFLHLYSFWFFAFSYLILGITAVFWLKKHFRQCFPTIKLTKIKKEKIWQIFKYFAFALLIIFITAGILDRLNYIGGSDAQTSHLVYIKKWIEAGKYYTLVNPRTDGLFHLNSTQPLMGRLLYLNGVILGNIHIAGLMQIGFAVLVFLGLYVLAKRIFNAKTAIAAFLLYAGNFFFWRYNLYEIDDYILNALFIVAVASALFLFYKKKSRNWLLLFSLLSGFLMSVKFHGLIAAAFFIITALLIIAHFVKTKQFIISKKDYLILLPMVLIPLPWFLMNTIVFRNPIYPYLTSILGGIDLGVWYKTYWHYILPYNLGLSAIKPTDTLLILPKLRVFFGNLLAHWPITGYPSWFTFSPLYLPAITIGLFRKNPIVKYAVAYFIFFYFFAGLSGSSPKYMILILTVITPGLAYVLLNISKNKIYQFFIFAILVVLTFHSFFSWGNFKQEQTWFITDKPNIKILKDLDKNTLTITNGLLRYERNDITTPIVSAAVETDQTVEDWENFYCFWKKQGATHYIYKAYTENDTAWSAYTPLMRQFNDPNIEYVIGASNIWRRNIKDRDDYLSTITELDKSGNLQLIKLNDNLPEFCNN